ncbi:MAG: TetR/AcrR family transcriptional regulator [Bdellovibrionota bacterium]
MKKSAAKTPVKHKILDAALSVIRSKGYAATTLDELCASAGVTKGAFFHHFKSKEDLAVSAARHWSSVTNEFFENAPYRRLSDPLERVFGYVDFRKEILRGKLPEFTCLVGTMVQEVFDTNPSIRKACQESIFGHAAEVAKDIQLAKKRYAPDSKWTAESLALHIQAVIQGAFILAKAKQDADIAAESVTHLRQYLEFLFEPSNLKKRRKLKLTAR